MKFIESELCSAIFDQDRHLRQWSWSSPTVRNHLGFLRNHGTKASQPVFPCVQHTSAYQDGGVRNPKRSSVGSDSPENGTNFWTLRNVTGPFPTERSRQLTSTIVNRPHIAQPSLLTRDPTDPTSCSVGHLWSHQPVLCFHCLSRAPGRLLVEGLGVVPNAWWANFNINTCWWLISMCQKIIIKSNSNQIPSTASRGFTVAGSLSISNPFSALLVWHCLLLLVATGISVDVSYDGWWFRVSYHHQDPLGKRSSIQTNAVQTMKR